MKRFASIFAAFGPILARDAAGLVGLGSISYGSWLVYPPAGFIVGGIFLAAASYLLARRG